MDIAIQFRVKPSTAFFLMQSISPDRGRVLEKGGSAPLDFTNHYNRVFHYFCCLVEHAPYTFLIIEFRLLICFVIAGNASGVFATAHAETHRHNHHTLPSHLNFSALGSTFDFPLNPPIPHHPSPWTPSRSMNTRFWSGLS